MEQNNNTEKMSFLHVECSKDQKSLFITAAKAKQMKLAEFIIETLTKESVEIINANKKRI